jgi:hypothetical protein
MAAGASPGPARDAAIALFAKTPVPGRVKTRLAPPLGPVQAAHVARALLDLTLASIVPAVPARWTLFLDGPPDEALRAAARECGLDIEPQAAGDLGERLAAAFDVLRSRGAARTLAIGADSPTLDPARVREAIESLDDADVVLGPTEDGGYYLVGVRDARREIFRDIPWSTDAVLATTLDRARESRLTVRILAAWYDVDGPEDLRRLREELAEGNRERRGGRGAAPAAAAAGALLGLLEAL